MSQFGKEFDRNEDEYADKQVANNLIKEFQSEVKKLNSVIRTQSNLINKLEKFEVDNISNLIELNHKLTKIEKHTKINNVNIHLLERRLDNLDKFIQNLLKKQKGINRK